MNPLNKIYRCPFTASVFLEDQYGNLQGEHSIRTYVEGKEDATYRVSCDQFRPRGYQALPQSIHSVSGIVRVYNGRAFLSTSFASFIYIKVPAGRSLNPQPAPQQPSVVSAKRKVPLFKARAPQVKSRTKPAASQVTSSVPQSGSARSLASTKAPASRSAKSEGSRSNSVKAQPRPKSQSLRPQLVSLDVSYVDVRTSQVIQHGQIKGRTGQLINVANRMPVRHGYRFEPNHSLTVKLNPNRKRFQIGVEPIQQPVTMQVEYLDVAHHQIVQRGEVKGYAGRSASVKEQVPIPKHYQVLPNQDMTVQLSQKLKHLTINVRSVRRIHHNYLTINVLTKNAFGKWTRRQPQFKPIHGYVGEQRIVRASDFQPRGYHLVAKSVPTLNLKITPSGLSTPQVTWKYVSDQVAKGTLKVVYVDQTGKTVGTGVITMPVGKPVDIPRHVKLPAGCQYRRGPLRPTMPRGKRVVKVHVINRTALKKSFKVSYLVVRCSMTGHILGQQKRTANVSGRVGQRFSIKPVTKAPNGFRIAGNPRITGQITAGGAHVTHRMITLMQLPTQPVNVKYVAADDSRHVLDQGQLTGKFGQTIEITQKLSVPRGYHLLPGQQTTCQINGRVQNVTLKIAANVQVVKSNARPKAKATKSVPKAESVAKSAAKPSAAPETEPAKKLASSTSVKKPVKRPASSSSVTIHLKASASARPEFQTGPKPQVTSFSYQQPSSSVHHLPESSQTKSKPAVKSSQSSSTARQVSTQPASSSGYSNHTYVSGKVGRKYDKLVIKQAFLGRYYDLVYHTHHYYGVGLLANQGIKMANSCIKGVNDARTQRPLSEKDSPGYVLGYTTFDKIRKEKFSHHKKPISLFRAALMALNTFLVNK